MTIREPITPEQWDAYIEHSMTNHPPVNEHVVQRFEALRQVAKEWAEAIALLCPANSWKEQAIFQAENSLMWAVKAVACDQENLPELPMPEVADSIADGTISLDEDDAFDESVGVIMRDETEVPAFPDPEALEIAAEVALQPPVKAEENSDG